MGSYTILTLVAMLAVIAAELLFIRSGVFRRPAYWIALAICVGFQFPVDGWLTKLSSPIVLYSPEVFSGVRVGWDSPIEDFGFGFAMMTLALALWVRAGVRAGGRAGERERPAATERARTRPSADEQETVHA